MRRKISRLVSNHSLTFLMIIAVMCIGLGLVLSRWIYSGPQNQISFLGVVVDFFLTSTLIIVYFKIARDTSEQTDRMDEQLNLAQQQAENAERQADLQENVTEIQKRQQKLMEANFNPEVVVGDQFEAVENKISIQLTNKGTGLAKSLSFKFDFYVDTAEGNTELIKIGDRIVEYEEYWEEIDGEILIRKGIKEPNGSLTETSMSDTPQVDAGAVLPSGESAQFETPIQFWYYGGWDATSGEGSLVSFSQAIENLQGMNINTLAYRIHLTYQNILGEEHEPQKIAEGAVRISESPDLEALLAARNSTAIFNYDSVPMLDGLHAEFDVPFQT